MQKKLLLIPIVIIAILGFGIVASMMRTVPSGFKGVRTQWGSITGTTGEGLQWANWIVGENVELVNIQIQAFESDPQSTASIDLQEATTTVTINYRVDETFAEEIFRDLRDQYEGRIIRPQLEDALKATTAKFTSTDMILTRESVRTSLENLLKERLSPYHIIVLSVSMTDFQFSDSFNAQLEATATAQKQVLEEQANLEIAKLQQQQKVIQALAEYNVTVTNAEAQKIATIMEAEGTAEAVRILSEELGVTPEYLTYIALTQWDGQLPTYWSSDNPIPFLDIGETTPPI